MLEGLLAAHRRYDELSAQLSQPDAASDIGRYRALMKEYKELEPLSRQYLALAWNARRAGSPWWFPVMSPNPWTTRSRSFRPWPPSKKRKRKRRSPA